MQMSVLVADCSELERGKQIAELAYDAGADAWFYSSDKVHVPDWYADVDLPPEIDLLILHNNDKSQIEGLNCSFRLTVRYTGGTAVPASRGDQFWIQRPIKFNSTLAHEEMTGILGWAGEVCGGYNDAVLPEILGGAKNGLARRFLSALLPIGLIWESAGRDAVLSHRYDKNRFEGAVCLRLHQHLSGEHTMWPPPRHERYVDSLNSRIHSQISTRAGTAGLASKAIEGPDYLDSTLKWLAASGDAAEWVRRLDSVRDLLLKTA